MKTKAGFTLVELLLALAIISIVLFFCMPFTGSFYKKNQLQLLSDEIQNAILYAKTEVLLHGTPLVLAPLPGSADWSKGLVLFVDTKNHQYAEGVAIMHEWHWRDSDIKIEWHGFQSKHYLLFARDISHSAINGHFLIRDNSKQHKLIINRLGRVRRSSLN